MAMTKKQRPLCIAMLDNEDETDLIGEDMDREFGTGGLRGIMGAGTNRMNIYAVGAAARGCRYLKKAWRHTR